MTPGLVWEGRWPEWCSQDRILSDTVLVMYPWGGTNWSNTSRRFCIMLTCGACERMTQLEIAWDHGINIKKKDWELKCKAGGKSQDEIKGSNETLILVALVLKAFGWVARKKTCYSKELSFLWDVPTFHLNSFRTNICMCPCFFQWRISGFLFAVHLILVRQLQL